MCFPPELKNVLFYVYDENADMEEAMLQYFTRKVDRSLQQDKKAKREVQEHSCVTAVWLTDCLGKPCNGRGDALIHEGGKNNRTAKRIHSTCRARAGQCGANVLLVQLFLV